MMNSKMMSLVLGLAALGVLGAEVVPVRPDWDKPNWDKNKIAPYTLEDPLAFADGTKLKSPAEWPKRRAEILSIFAKEMFGAEPPRPEAVVTEKFDDAVTLSGFGIRRQYHMWFRKDKTGPMIDWLVILPAKAKGPVPVIAFLNYSGNHTLLSDKEVRMPEGVWLQFDKDNRADPAKRGSSLNPNSNNFLFPVTTILSRGYAVMSACYGQVSPDPSCREKDPAHRQDPFAYTGVFDLWPKRDPGRDDNPTAIGAWAWALSRGLDLAYTIPEIDAKRAVATGYSRLGKTAFLSAARDERWAVCVPNQTGGGGCPLAKRDFGENVGTEMKSFTHWYCAAYGKYRKNPAKLLTFDQHLLIAAIAPRALLVQGFDAPWFDTEGEYLACRAANPVWKFLNAGPMPEKPYPDDYDTSCIGRGLGYVRRDLWHGHSAHDWTWLLDFADKALGAMPVESIQARVDACAAKGGGRVVVPAGEWKTGPIHLRSNVELHLEEGAKLIFSSNPDDYRPLVRSSFSCIECYTLSPLVYGYGCTNVAVTGKGTLMPQMDVWRVWFDRNTPGMLAAMGQLYAWGESDEPVENRRAPDLPGARFRPSCVEFERCQNVRLEDFRVRESPLWTIHLRLCENVHVRGLDLQARGHNNDGIDVDASKHVLIEDCVLDQGDDGFVIKSGRDRDGRRVGVPCEDVEIRNCTVHGAHTLIAVGSEVAGGIRNIRLHDCRADAEIRALLSIKTSDRKGGFIENIAFSNVTATAVKYEVVRIATDVDYQWKKYEPRERIVTPIKNVYIANVICDQAKRVYSLKGDARLPVKNVTLTNVRAKNVVNKDNIVENVDGFEEK